MENDKKYSLTNGKQITGDGIAVRDMLVQERPANFSTPKIETIQEKSDNKAQDKHIKDMPMAWWNFWKYFRFPFSIITYTFSTVYYFATNNIITPVTLFYLLDVAEIIFLCITYYHFLKLNEVGYKFLNIWLIIECLLTSLNIAVREGTFDIARFIVVASIVGLNWILPNYIYFKKRKVLFNNKTSIEGKHSEQNDTTENTYEIWNKVLEIILVISIIILVLTLMDFFYYTPIIKEKELQIQNLNTKIADKNDETSEFQIKYNDIVKFMDRHVTICPVNSRFYHKYGCKHLDTSSGYYIYSTNDVENKGYVACPYCN